MQKPTYYVTTPIYYPSANLHIGHTYTTVAADALARFKRVTGYDVMFLTGTDEHGQKIENVAKKANLEPKKYLDGMIAEIKDLWSTMEISYDKFIRTTDVEHEKRVQAIFQKLYDKGDIYKGEYEGMYCTPCESFWTEAQLEDGCCPDCNGQVQKTKESAYFFKLSKYAPRLRELLSDGKFLKPQSRANEMIKNFIDAGLEDLCITRSSFSWGIPVPFDPEHVIYVWLDALSNYITALDYPDSMEKFNRYWPADVHLVGKEIVRFHTIIWPAMLMAMELPLPKHVFAHGWLLFGGGKMSKSKGNIVDPRVLIDKYSVDGLKYFLLREYQFGSDGNFSTQALLNRMNSDLSNDLGNLVSRSVAMVEKYNDGILPESNITLDLDEDFKCLAVGTAKRVENKIDELDFSGALEEIWKLIARANKYIDETTPWTLAKEPDKKEELNTVLYNLIESIRIISVMIQPFMVHASGKIWEQIGITEGELTEWESSKIFGLMKSGVKLTKKDSLFPRIDVEKELEELEKMLNENQSEKSNNSNENDKNSKQKSQENKEDKQKKVSKSDKNSKIQSDKSDEISIDEFGKVKLVVAKIEDASKHPNADKLLVLKLKVGEEHKQVVSGIAKDYTVEELVGMKVILVANLKPAKLRGVKSEGMILAASNDDGLKLLTVDMPDGTVVS